MGETHQMPTLSQEDRVKAAQCRVDWRGDRAQTSVFSPG
jgi:hypothetical protein